ncbi:MAG: acrylyl-CoA reductase (NADPH) [Chloroflexaceae bacterium]
MSDETFRALVVDESGGSRRVKVRDVPVSDLPPGEVLVRVAYSTLNFKDGLAVTGKGKILRSTPMVPGIDFAGTVVESASPQLNPGDQVVLTGWGVGERHWGGYSQFNRVKADWLVPLPEGMSLRQAMAIGTAGFTAMLCVQALERHGVQPGGREVLVTGAAGGVGSVAVALLARAGYQVVAATGRLQEEEYLKSLGAASVIDRAVLTAPGRPLETERWAGAVDTVGGAVLGGIFRSVAYYGVVAACGNAGGAEFTTSVFPFILRGVQLIGVESVMVPPEQRREAWARIARDLPGALIDRLTQVIPMSAVPEYSETITRGQVRGRIVVDVNA